MFKGSCGEIIVPRSKGFIKQITATAVVVRFEDGQEAFFPRDKVPKGVEEGTLVSVSINIDRIANLLKQANLASEGITLGAPTKYGS